MRKRQRAVPDAAWYPAEAHRVLRELKDARRAFEGAAEPALVEAAVYRLKSLELRYVYLLQKSKELTNE